MPPPSQLSVPHSLTAAEDKQLLCVADRENGRILCFNYDGTFNKQIKAKEFGPYVYAVKYCPLHGKFDYFVLKFNSNQHIVSTCTVLMALFSKL